MIARTCILKEVCGFLFCFSEKGQEDLVPGSLAQSLLVLLLSYLGHLYFFLCKKIHYFLMSAGVCIYIYQVTTANL